MTSPGVSLQLGASALLNDAPVIPPNKFGMNLSFFDRVEVSGSSRPGAHPERTRQQGRRGKLTNDNAGWFKPRWMQAFPSTDALFMSD